MMEELRCPFCGLYPYETYGGQRIVTCCREGDLYFAHGATIEAIEAEEQNQVDNELRKALEDSSDLMAANQVLEDLAIEAGARLKRARVVEAQHLQEIDRLRAALAEVADALGLRQVTTEGGTARYAAVGASRVLDAADLIYVAAEINDALDS